MIEFGAVTLSGAWFVIVDRIDQNSSELLSMLTKTLPLSGTVQPLDSVLYGDTIV